MPHYGVCVFRHQHVSNNVDNDRKDGREEGMGSKKKIQGRSREQREGGREDEG
jgi:hypothetical protein